MHIMVCFSN